MDGVLTLETCWLNMCSTWHMATASIHRRKTHTEQSALNAGYQNNRKKRMKPLSNFSFEMTGTHTRTSIFSQPSFFAQILLHPIYPPPLFSSSQSALYYEWKCLCVCEEHSGAWCGLGQTNCQGHGTHKPSTQLALSTHAHRYRQSEILSELTTRETVTSWYKANNLPCSR